MTANTSIKTLGQNSERLVELDEERLRDSHPVECHEAWHRLLRTPSKAGCGVHGAQTVQQTEVQGPRTGLGNEAGKASCDSEMNV